VKAISLWQPWASLMAAGLKKIETRSWPTSYRGDLVICSTKTTPPNVRRWLLESRQPDALAIISACHNHIREQPAGVALCLVHLAACWPTEEARTTVEAQAELAFGDYNDGRFAWFTTDIRPFAVPFAVRGRQGMFDIDDAIVANALLATERLGV
jgi:activating signal cointegrator 1